MFFQLMPELQRHPDASNKSSCEVGSLSKVPSQFSTAVLNAVINFVDAGPDSSL